MSRYPTPPKPPPIPDPRPCRSFWIRRAAEMRRWSFMKAEEALSGAETREIAAAVLQVTAGGSDAS